jgi:hypothetical protein
MSTPVEHLITKSEAKKAERIDPLKARQQPPDRVFYATGVLLDAVDFSAEQTYHRAQLARGLAHLHGSGTAAGLKVSWIAASPDPDASDAQQEELRVEPGIAVDRLGRFIEVPRTACIRLRRWFDNEVAERADDLIQALYTGAEAAEVSREDDTGAVIATDRIDGVVADLFIRFVVCERGKTPAFASGPFDALDAVEPSRLRDGYELKLLLRKERPLRMPERIWPTDSNLLHKAIFDAWHKTTDRTEILGQRDASELKPLQEHAEGQDTSFVFVARVVLPAEIVGDNPVPQRTADDVRIDNHIRPFVYTAGALARLMGL